MADSDSIKLCECGCGKPAPIATQTKKKWGHVQGQPMRFIRGHGYVRHRLTKTPTYHSWRQMRNRCQNPKATQWPLYGARGITVCERWQSFDNFLADMGLRPSGTTLDRINNDGNYEPANCRWADGSTQSSNKRNNRVLTAFGRSMTITTWERVMGLGRNNISLRIDTLGWSVEKAISTPRQKRTLAP
jgi:hypothetical protein